MASEWPRRKEIGLGLGLDLKALASVSASRFWPRLTSLHRSKETQQDCPTAFVRESHQDQPHVTAATPAKDFFGGITSKRNATIARPDADAGVETYLSDPSSELSSLEAYPNMRQVYLKLITDYWATSQCRCRTSALFSLGGRVFSPVRSRLSSEHFEMMLFLHTAAKW